ncbi:MAG TPA: carboxypeptidase-like regulatory domain-containing protein, partial [Chryseosolibacter sp.]|nr:carboxypeptidase-like regulatory domain-containing protein [Chryseosolibacter sp.]
TVSAKVHDQESGEPLGFASVGIKGQPIGTISNANGEFDFHFPVNLRNDTLVISMLGYKNFEAPVWSLVEKPDQVLTLQKSQIVLQEIIVSDTITGGEVLRLALQRIEENYPMQPFLLDGFYRDVKKVGGTYISLLEAAVKIYDENYTEPRNKHKLRERVRLIEVRKSVGYESKFTTYFDQANLLEDLLLENSIRYRHIEPSDEFFATLGRDTNTVFDNHEIYVVKSIADSSLRVFVDKTDFSIIHLEYRTTQPSTELQKKKNLVSRFMGSRKSLDFKRYNGKMYLSFVEMTTKINWYDGSNGELRFETEVFQQLLVNRVQANVDERIAGTERMRNYGLQYQDLPYNKEFWDNYNVIKETPLDKKIIVDLEKVGPLEKQFADY